MEIVLAGGNMHKKREISEILQDHTIVLPEECGVRFSHEETGTTYLDNALGKARALYRKIGRPVIADDSGISVPALGGAPGVYSARFGSDEGRKGLDDVGRYELLLEKMVGREDRSAFYVCCMVLLLEDYRFFACQETLHGELMKSPVGNGGFGYDPIFFLPDRNKTVAEISSAEKNEISHRGRAGRRIGEILASLGRELP
jgi:XTP/dITP diphosphohydrolase